MAEPQPPVRSARAKALAYKLAKKEQRTISQVVECALELYAKPERLIPEETPHEFWDRITKDYATEHNLEEILEEHRKPQHGIEL